MDYAWERRAPANYRGVCWHKRIRKYRVKIKSSGKIYNLGYYDDPIDAAIVYDVAAKRLHGPDAKLNWPTSAPKDALWAEMLVTEKLA